MENILRYTYGTAEIARSRVSLRELDDLKISAGFTNEDQRYRRLAGGVLADQTKQIVDHWRRGIIASIPNLARHWHTPEGNPIPEYMAAPQPWCKSLPLQFPPRAGLYSDAGKAPSEW